VPHWCHIYNYVKWIQYDNRYMREINNILVIIDQRWVQVTLAPGIIPKFHRILVYHYPKGMSLACKACKLARWWNACGTLATAISLCPVGTVIPFPIFLECCASFLPSIPRIHVNGIVLTQSLFTQAIQFTFQIMCICFYCNTDIVLCFSIHQYLCRLYQQCNHGRLQPQYSTSTSGVLH